MGIALRYHDDHTYDDSVVVEVLMLGTICHAKGACLK